MSNKFNIGDFVKMATSGWTPEAFNNAMDRIEKMNAEEMTEPSEAVESEEVDEKDKIIENLQNQIKNLQNKNVHQSAPDVNQATDEDILNNALLGLLS